MSQESIERTGFIVDYYNGHERMRRRMDSDGTPLVTTATRTSAYVYAIEQILFDILSDDEFDLSIFIRHSDCNPEWLKTMKSSDIISGVGNESEMRSKPNSNDLVDVSLWNLAPKASTMDNAIPEGIDDYWKQYQINIETLIYEWKRSLLETIDKLSSSERKVVTIDLKKWMDSMLRHGFNKYDPDEGHWIEIKKIDLYLK